MLNEEWGTYAKGVITLEGGFTVNGTSDPDGIKDYNTNMIASVTLVSTGLFEVTLADWLPYLPEKIVVPGVFIASDVTPTGAGLTARMVIGSWSPATRKFRIQCSVVGTATDPEDNTEIAFFLRGSGLAVGTD